jgi:hypothetical protein
MNQNRDTSTSPEEEALALESTGRPEIYPVIFTLWKPLLITAKRMASCIAKPADRVAGEAGGSKRQ